MKRPKGPADFTVDQLTRWLLAKVGTITELKPGFKLKVELIGMKPDGEPIFRLTKVS